jgi:hypothetical protein
MPEKTLQEAFGAEAVQTATTITFSKPNLGLSAATCTADQVMAALAIKARQTLTQEFYNTEIAQNVYITDGFSSLPTRGDSNTPYRVDQIVINLAQPDTQSTLNPNNY